MMPPRIVPPLWLHYCRTLPPSLPSSRKSICTAEAAKAFPQSRGRVCLKSATLEVKVGRCNSLGYTEMVNDPDSRMRFEGERGIYLLDTRLTSTSPAPALSPSNSNSQFVDA